MLQAVQAVRPPLCMALPYAYRAFHVSEGAARAVRAQVARERASASMQRRAIAPVRDITAASGSPEEKLRRELRRVQEENYTYEMPSRMEKEIAAAADGGKGYVTPGDLCRILSNMAGEGCECQLSEKDARILWSKHGGLVDASRDMHIPTATFVAVLHQQL